MRKDIKCSKFLITHYQWRMVAYMSTEKLFTTVMEKHFHHAKNAARRSHGKPRILITLMRLLITMRTQILGCCAGRVMSCDLECISLSTQKKDAQP
ncbi:hypothetical protein BFV64_09995 [Enterobacter kobei]|nr:hypothetical protein BFV64_09995 [Enterobacter kobei]